MNDTFLQTTYTNLPNPNMSIPSTKQKHLVIWLKLMCLAVICMIFIGGFTRLTHSGLSITEWKPVAGVIPPLNEQAWIQEFDQYKQSPEYLKINNHMGLAEFKTIFWVEFIHRIAGRVTGMLYLLPFVFFLINGIVRGKDVFIYIGGAILLVGQGFAGWYMVKSGLTSDPHVSHFRLAIHLLLAVLLYALLFWQLMRNCHLEHQPLYPGAQSATWGSHEIATDSSQSMLGHYLNLSLFLLLIQIVFGALVAGLNAGLVYNEFPLMGETFIPHEVTLANISLQSFSEPVFVQFVHRITAYIVMVAIFIACFKGFKIKNPTLTKALIYLILALVFQVMLGITTLIYSVPLIIALLHQLGAVIVLSCLIWAKVVVNMEICLPFKQ